MLLPFAEKRRQPCCSRSVNSYAATHTSDRLNDGRSGFHGRSSQNPNFVPHLLGSGNGIVFHIGVKSKPSQKACWLAAAPCQSRGYSRSEPNQRGTRNQACREKTAIPRDVGGRRKRRLHSSDTEGLAVEHRILA